MSAPNYTFSSFFFFGTFSLLAFNGNDVIDDEEELGGVGEPTRWRA